MKISEVAKCVGLTYDQAYDHVVVKKSLKASKVLGQWEIRREDYEDWKASGAPNPTPQREPDTLTISEVAEKVGLTYEQVYWRVRNGQIPSVKVGRRYFIKEKDCLAWSHKEGLPVPATDPGTLNRPPLAAMAAAAQRIRRDIVEMTTAAGSGHPSSSLSAVEIMTALYFGGLLRHDAARPEWPERDRFILSKGHAAPILYAVLAERGYFGVDRLASLRRLGSPLEGHPNMRRLPGVEASTGSLGQGLSIGLGHALAGRVDGRDYQVYVLLGDGGGPGGAGLGGGDGGGAIPGRFAHRHRGPQQGAADGPRGARARLPSADGQVGSVPSGMSKRWTGTTKPPCGTPSPRRAPSTAGRR